VWQRHRQLTNGAASHEAPIVCLLEHPSWRLAGLVVHAWSSTACWWLVVYAKFIGTAVVTTAPLFHIEVIDDWA
jgi:hypothetical protein